MIHLDIIKYILNPLLNWDDCSLVPCVVTHVQKKKHYSPVTIDTATLSFKFDSECICIEIKKTYFSWNKEGAFHREDLDRNGLTLPAWIWSDGSKYWYKDGKLHNFDKDINTGLTLPAIIDRNGNKYWYKNGKLHNLDKDLNGHILPAYISNHGDKYWYIEGNIHRRPK